MQSLKQQFVSWVAQQDPNTRYAFVDSSQCAIAQFEQHLGLPKRALLSGDIADIYGFALLEAVSISATFGEIVSELKKSEHKGAPQCHASASINPR